MSRHLLLSFDYQSVLPFWEVINKRKFTKIFEFLETSIVNSSTKNHCFWFIERKLQARGQWLPISLLIQQFTFIPKLFDFWHFFEWVEFHIIVDCEKTIHSRRLIFTHIKLIFPGFKMSPQWNVCVSCVSSYSRLV